jgi:aminobenzoyl-glutamate utilization protein B
MNTFAKAEDAGKMTSEKKTAINWIDANKAIYEEIAKYLWEHPELSLVEFKSSAKLERYLEKNGFKIEKGASGMSTAFVATWSSGKPVIGFMAEYDALPNLSQKAGVTRQDPIVVGAPGHGCGHNLLGTSCCTAAIATKVAMEKHDIEGTVKVFGTPAEETLVGKIIMARDGVFDGTDIMICWHPEDTNGVFYKCFRAITSVKFQFTGEAVHSGSAPEAGRSALEAVELMDIGTSFMREHVIREASIQYVITRGGEVPNIVPPDAEVWYFIRAPRRSQVDKIWGWLHDIARGAALMTQTRMNYKLLAATWEVLPNRILAQLGDSNATMIGPEPFTLEDHKFGEEIIKSLGREIKGSAFDTMLAHPDFSKTFPDVEIFKPSWDLGNVSWMVPTLSFSIVTKATGTPQHSWQMVSQTNSPPALKAGVKVSQWMAASALDCFTHPEIISEAWKEHDQYLAETKFYHPIPADFKLPTFKDLYGIEPESIPKLPEME